VEKGSRWAGAPRRVGRTAAPRWGGRRRPAARAGGAIGLFLRAVPRPRRLRARLHRAMPRTAGGRRRLSGWPACWMSGWLNDWLSGASNSPRTAATCAANSA